MSPRPIVTLYGRPECHLCEEARAAIERVATRVELELHDVDISTDDELHKRYLERIPVVLVNGEHLFEFEVDEGMLEQLLHLSSPSG